MEHTQPPQQQSPSSASAWRSAGLFAVRYGIGGVMVLVGILVLVIVPGETGARGLGWAIGAGLSLLLLKAGLAMLLLTVLARVSARGGACGWPADRPTDSRDNMSPRSA